MVETRPREPGECVAGEGDELAVEYERTKGPFEGERRDLTATVTERMGNIIYLDYDAHRLVVSPDGHLYVRDDGGEDALYGRVLGLEVVD